MLLVASDHHGSWDAIEEAFSYAKKKGIPFVINGDIVGDYNFENLAFQLNLKFPYQLMEENFKKSLGEEVYEKYMTYSQIAQNNGDYSFILNQSPPHFRSEVERQITSIIKEVEMPEFQNNLKKVVDDGDLKRTVEDHRIKLRELYDLIIKVHAKRLAYIIDRYGVKTYFLNGNHEPSYFPKLVIENLKDKSLFVDLGKADGIVDVNGIRIAGVSNVNQLLGFLHQIYSPEELNEKFSHQRTPNRPILFGNVSIETLENKSDHERDFDWVRIVRGEKDIDLDVFFTHGQIGTGSWRDDRHAREMPTLHVAAMLSSLAKLTVDGHLHTTHEMRNPLGKTSIRAVGNRAYVISKVGSEIKYELVEFESKYLSRGGITFEDLSLEIEELDRIFKN